MADIEIELPFKIHIDFVSDAMHRVELLMTCAASSVWTAVNEATKKDWVHHNDWDAFVKDVYLLKKGEKKAASLTAEGYHDTALITLLTNEAGTTITVYYNVTTMTYKPNIRCEIAANITTEELGILYEKLSAFAKWW